MPFALLVLVLAACAQKQTVGPCDLLCAELVDTCQVAAYPDTNSCLEGCLYDQDQGSNIEAETTCVQGAACDLFVIVECEHQFGSGGR